jgi:hypothetical protein
MKTLLTCILIFGLIETAPAQEEGNSFRKFRAVISFGITPINPEQINERIGNSNYVLNSETKSVKSLPEFAATISFRPQDDFKILILRAGHASIERAFRISLPQTTTSSAPTGTITGEVVERYSVLPFSFGIGATTRKSDFQFQIELIYALSIVTEEGNYKTTSGDDISYSRELTSPAYGMRVAGNASVPINPTVSIVFELGYRIMTFDEYEDEKALRYSFFEFPVSGVNVSAGLALTL